MNEDLNGLELSAARTRLLEELQVPALPGDKDLYSFQQALKPVGHVSVHNGLAASFFTCQLLFSQGHSE